MLGQCFCVLWSASFWFPWCLVLCLLYVRLSLGELCFAPSFPCLLGCCVGLPEFSSLVFLLVLTFLAVLSVFCAICALVVCALLSCLWPWSLLPFFLPALLCSLLLLPDFPCLAFGFFCYCVFWLSLSCLLGVFSLFFSSGVSPWPGGGLGFRGPCFVCGLGRAAA